MLHPTGMSCSVVIINHCVLALGAVCIKGQVVLASVNLWLCLTRASESKQGKMPNKCCVYGCSNTKGFYFPMESVQRKHTIITVQIDKWIPTACSIMCGGHFQQDHLDGPTWRCKNSNTAWVWNLLVWIKLIWCFTFDINIFKSKDWMNLAFAHKNVDIRKDWLNLALHLRTSVVSCFSIN